MDGPRPQVAGDAKNARWLPWLFEARVAKAGNRPLVWLRRASPYFVLPKQPKVKYPKRVVHFLPVRELFSPTADKLSLPQSVLAPK